MRSPTPGRAAGDIDAVIVSCANLQRPYPAIAIEVQNALGIEGFAFDMNVGWHVGNLFALTIASDMMPRGERKPS